MTIFTDAGAAVEEAVYLAEQTDQAQAIIRDPGCAHNLRVMSVARARFDRMEILESCEPPREDAA